MKKIILILIMVIIVAGVYVLWPEDDSNIRNVNIKPNDIIFSPLIVKGEARTWFFEGDFPVYILDADDNEIARGFAQAQGEWMVPDFVAFKAEIEFENPSTETGTLVLAKDNPSDKRELDEELRIPVRFDDTKKSRDIELFYYNIKKDADISCNPDFVLPVGREIPISMSPIQDTIRLLLKGELNEKEKNEGFQTEFPLEGFELAGADLQNGVLTLEFNDINRATIGGSCRVGLLRAQVVKTAEQFEEVKEVKFEPEFGYFQP